MSEIFYVNWRILGKIIQYNIIKFPSLRRVLFTLVFVIGFIAYLAVLFVFRILDEIFFSGYRKVEVKEPVFIISNPRSGTTFLHRLLSLDRERYVYPLLYHTIFPSATFFSIINFFSAIDSKIGQPMRWCISKFDAVVFKGWETIHPMGLKKTEEDEGFFALAMWTPALILFSPFITNEHQLDFLDDASPEEKRKMRNFYLSSVKRFLHIEGADKTLLNKNVFDSGRIYWLMETFPTAKIIYPVRNPYEAVPSVVSMFTVSWAIHSPDVPLDSVYAKNFGWLAIKNYKHFYDFQKQMDRKNLVTFTYDALISSPQKAVESIYTHFNWPISAAFQQAIIKNQQRSSQYKSKHQYSLSQFGITEAEIYEYLKEVFEFYGFKV